MTKSKLGTRYTCFECGTRFYDLNRPDPICPNCGADQRQAPAKDIEATLAAGRRSRKKGRGAPAEPLPSPSSDELDDDIDDEDLFDDDGDDDDDLDDEDDD
jgi:hypothetical protein